VPSHAPGTRRAGIRSVGEQSPTRHSMPPNNAAELYKRISENPELTRDLFRQALQDPSGALGRIVEIGAAEGLPVDPEQVKAHIASLDDGATKQWLIKARGGL
jgi:hypothetical protein